MWEVRELTNAEKIEIGRDLELDEHEITLSSGVPDISIDEDGEVIVTIIKKEPQEIVCRSLKWACVVDGKVRAYGTEQEMREIEERCHEI